MVSLEVYATRAESSGPTVTAPPSAAACAEIPLALPLHAERLEDPRASLLVHSPAPTLAGGRHLGPQCFGRLVVERLRGAWPHSSCRRTGGILSGVRDQRTGRCGVAHCSKSPPQSAGELSLQVGFLKFSACRTGLPAAGIRPPARVSPDRWRGALGRTTTACRLARVPGCARTAALLRADRRSARG